MEFELSQQLILLQREIFEFASQHLVHDAVARAAHGSFPRDVSLMLVERGWAGLAAAPPESGGGLLASVVAVETLARCCPRSADALHQLNFGAALLLSEHATNEVHRALLQAILTGRTLVAVAITEDTAGAQATAQHTHARIEDGVVCLEGHKKYAANSADADAFVVYAKFGESIEDVGALIVERDQGGLLIRKPVTFMNGERWCRLDFQSARLHTDNILFCSGGFSSRAGIFGSEKLGHAARALGLGWCAFDRAVDYAMNRRQFERPICEFQGVHWKLAEARLLLEAAQMTLYRAAWRADRRTTRGEDAASAKILCNRAAMSACDSAVQVMGAAGYSDEALTEYCFRKARGHMINGGVIELMLTQVAEAIFERKFSQTAS